MVQVEETNRKSRGTHPCDDAGCYLGQCAKIEINPLRLTCTATHLPWRAMPGNAVRRSVGTSPIFAKMGEEGWW